MEYGDFKIEEIARTGEESIIKIERDDRTQLYRIVASKFDRSQFERLELDDDSVSINDVTQSSDRISINPQTQSLDVSGAERIPTGEVKDAFRKRYCSGCCSVSAWSDHYFACAKIQINNPANEYGDDMLKDIICLGFSEAVGVVAGQGISHVANMGCKALLNSLDVIADETRFSVGLVDIDVDSPLMFIKTAPKVRPFIAPGFTENPNHFTIKGTGRTIHLSLPERPDWRPWRSPYSDGFAGDRGTVDGPPH